MSSKSLSIGRDPRITSLPLIVVWRTSAPLLLTNRSLGLKGSKPIPYGLRRPQASNRIVEAMSAASGSKEYTVPPPAMMPCCGLAGVGALTTVPGGTGPPPKAMKGCVIFAAFVPPAGSSAKGISVWYPMPLNSMSTPGKSWSVGVVSAQPLSGPTTLELVGAAPLMYARPSAPKTICEFG